MTQTNIFNGHYKTPKDSSMHVTGNFLKLMHLENLHGNVSGKRSVIRQKVRVNSAEGVGLEKTDTG